MYILTIISDSPTVKSPRSQIYVSCEDAVRDACEIYRNRIPKPSFRQIFNFREDLLRKGHVDGIVSTRAEAIHEQKLAPESIHLSPEVFESLNMELWRHLEIPEFFSWISTCRKAYQISLKPETWSHLIRKAYYLDYPYPDSRRVFQHLTKIYELLICPRSNLKYTVKLQEHIEMCRTLFEASEYAKVLVNIVSVINDSYIGRKLVYTIPAKDRYWTIQIYAGYTRSIVCGYMTRIVKVMGDSYITGSDQFYSGFCKNLSILALDMLKDIVAMLNELSVSPYQNSLSPLDALVQEFY